MKYDFHIHTTNSDGSMSPIDTLALTKETKMDTICLIDHDTLSSVHIAKKLNEQEKNINIYGGIEISNYCHSIKRNTHILAYNVDTHNKALQNICSITLQRRSEAFYQSVDIINKHGKVHIDKDKLESYKSINGLYMQHIMKYLVDIGYAKEIYGKIKQEIFSKKDGYAPVSYEYPTCEEAIQTVQNAGGIPILAHTFYSDNFSAINKMIDTGLMGIEVYHPNHTPAQREMLYNFCIKNNLLVTCGSDFHGIFNNTVTSIGCASAENEKLDEFAALLK